MTDADRALVQQVLRHADIHGRVPARLVLELIAILYQEVAGNAIQRAARDGARA